MQDEGAITSGEEGRDLRLGGGGAVGAAGHAGGGIAGDASAPRVGGLGRARIAGIRQGVARRHVHHHEGIEHHVEPTGRQFGDEAPEPGIGRRAAIGGG